MGIFFSAVRLTAIKKKRRYKVFSPGINLNVNQILLGKITLFPPSTHRKINIQTLP